MALRSSAAYFRSMFSRLSVNPSVKTKTKTHDHAAAGNSTGTRIQRAIRADFMPVYVSVGLILMSVSFGVHTVVQQLSRSPNVSVNKKRREMVPEVVEPERVVGDAERFISGGFFRKVAHVQNYNLQGAMPDSIHKDAFAWKREPKAETVKDVGVHPVKDTGTLPVQTGRQPETTA